MLEPRDGVTRQGIVLTDLPLFVDDKKNFSLSLFLCPNLHRVGIGASQFGIKVLKFGIKVLIAYSMWVAMLLNLEASLPHCPPSCQF